MRGETFDPFQVVVVPFPFTDKPTAKRRPALIVSTGWFNDRHSQFMLAMITSARHSAWPSDVRLQEWRAARLTAPCVVRFKLFTLDVSLILEAIGVLAEPDRQATAAMVSRCMAFSDITPKWSAGGGSTPQSAP